MRKALFFTMLVFVFFSCEKDEDSSKTTYQIINNCTYNESSIDYLDGTMWEIIVIKYIDDDIAGQDNVDPVSPDGGKSDIIEIDNDVEKLKVSYKYLPQESEYYDLDINERKYVAAYTYLDEGENNVITITNSTLVSKASEPNHVEILKTDFNKKFNEYK